MKVLIVDDEQTNLKVAQGYLTICFPSLEYMTCQYPEKVIEILETNTIDIVLIDIMMPKISGKVLIEKIRKNEKYNGIELVVLTAISERDTLKESFEAGANDYLKKPIEPVEFKARIYSAIKRREKYIKQMNEIGKKLNSCNLFASKIVEINEKMDFLISEFDRLKHLNLLDAKDAMNLESNMKKIQIEIKYCIEALEYL